MGAEAEIGMLLGTRGTALDGVGPTGMGVDAGFAFATLHICHIKTKLFYPCWFVKMRGGPKPTG